MKITQVLFPTDFSPASEPAGRVARELALQVGGTLHVIHVVPPVTDPTMAADRLNRAAADLGAGLAHEVALLSGRAAAEIVRYARDKGIGLVVLGTHGRTGVSRALLGSVAERVARTASCLVLTVPPGALAGGVAEAAEAAPPPALHRCVVCAGATEDLICEPCRTRIRGEALEHKLEAERAGRRGSPS